MTAPVRDAQDGRLLRPRADGRWIVTATNPHGMTCIVGAGYGFEVLPAPVAGVPG